MRKPQAAARWRNHHHNTASPAINNTPPIPKKAKPPTESVEESFDTPKGALASVVAAVVGAPGNGTPVEGVSAPATNGVAVSWEGITLVDVAESLSGVDVAASGVTTTVSVAVALGVSSGVTVAEIVGEGVTDAVGKGVTVGGITVGVSSGGSVGGGEVAGGGSVFGGSVGRGVAGSVVGVRVGMVQLTPCWSGIAHVAGDSINSPNTSNNKLPAQIQFRFMVLSP